MSNTHQRTPPGDAVGERALSLLASARRRAVVRCLLSAGHPVGVADLARDVLARERGVDPRDVPADDVERTYLRLHHVHLPKLAAADYLRHDDERMCVAPADEIHSLEPLLDVLADGPA